METKDQKLEKTLMNEKADLVETPQGIMALTGLVGLGIGLVGFSLSYLMGFSSDYIQNHSAKINNQTNVHVTTRSYNLNNND